MLKGTSEEGTDRGMDGTSERGEGGSERGEGGSERRREGARDGGKLQPGRYPDEGTGQVHKREPGQSWVTNRLVLYKVTSTL